ncbi:hypothetical protein KI387_007792 [Taxus chinensis]|uniref:Uncharacterized protein n=1 Tax=Taxus chinensis TaxID=29808 RepID=A0AA38GS09_TAXCH|nr:hypothetical protein KI387_007792 [Taxus chinensis]
MEKVSIWKLDEILSEDINNLNLNLTTWEEIRDMNPDLLLQEGVIDNVSNLFEYQKAMEFKSQVFQDLIKKLEDKHVEIVDGLSDILEEFDNINYNFQ